MLGDMELTSILSSSRVRTRWIDLIANANDASYFRLVPQAVVQLNSIGEIQSIAWNNRTKSLSAKAFCPSIMRAVSSMVGTKE